VKIHKALLACTVRPSSIRAASASWSAE
jgi:hypothetical protein